MKVSIAGPVAGLALFAVLYLSCYLPAVRQLLAQYQTAGRCMVILLFFNLMVNLMNLVPCLPLDGGQIMQALINRYSPRRAGERILQISILASGATAFWAFYCMQNHANVIPIPYSLLPDNAVRIPQPDPQFLVFFFGYLCANSVIAYNEYQGRY